MLGVEQKFHLGFGITLFLSVHLDWQRSPRSCTQMPVLSSQVHPKLLTHPHENLLQKSSLEREKTMILERNIHFTKNYNPRKLWAHFQVKLTKTSPLSKYTFFYLALLRWAKGDGLSLVKVKFTSHSAQYSIVKARNITSSMYKHLKFIYCWHAKHFYSLDKQVHLRHRNTDH